jgi:hypothetical protein
MNQLTQPSDIPQFIHQHNIIMHTDPGHGWIQVPLSLIRELGIGSSISGYSYQSGEFAYLEEDCDLGIFFHAIGIGFDENEQALSNQLRTIFWQYCPDQYKDRTPIRGYRQFNADVYPKPKHQTQIALSF